MTMKAPAWVDCAEDDVYGFVRLLRKPTGIGRFLPCPRGATTYGQRAELGFSCFALKLYYLFGWIPDLAVVIDQNGLISYNHFKHSN